MKQICSECNCEIKDKLDSESCWCGTIIESYKEKVYTCGECRTTYINERPVPCRKCGQNYDDYYELEFKKLKYHTPYIDRCLNETE